MDLATLKHLTLESIKTTELYTKGLQLDELTPTQLEYYTLHIYNGVGSANFPIKPPHLVFNPAAFHHDLEGWTGGSDMRRRLSDTDFFLRCMEIVGRYRYLRWYWYRIWASIYHFILSRLSPEAWEYLDEPANTWDELMSVVKDYYDRNPQEKRPITYKEFLKLKKSKP